MQLVEEAAQVEQGAVQVRHVLLTVSAKEPDGQEDVQELPLKYNDPEQVSQEDPSEQVWQVERQL